MKNARLIAFDVLYKIFYNDAYSNIALDNALLGVQKDKAFVSALVYGVTERKLTLDFFIGKYLKSKAKPKIMTVLRLGAYQILFMDKVPDSAAVNESVKLVKQINQGYYASLVNAVLHKITQDKQSVSDLKDLSVKYSVPENLLNMWSKQYSAKTVESFLPYINGRPPVFAVANTLFNNSKELSNILFNEGITCDIIDERVVKITCSFDLNKLKSFADGLFYIEDYSSYKCALSLNAKEGDIVFDMCSAPGGKAFTIASAMNNKGTIYAFDLYQHRLEKIQEGIERLKHTIIKTAVNDASKFNEALPCADKILCDVPCSGFGIVRRKPEIKYKELDSVSSLPELQYEILETSSKYLKNGGTLVYSTCTLNKKENEKVVGKFLDNNKNFNLVNEETAFPCEQGGDGFYYAVISKNES